MISVIIPIFNEEKVLSKSSPYLHKLAQCAELIFVDGGSTDKSLEIAKQHGKVILDKKGRALQMNSGVSFAKSEILLFLHADTFIPIVALKSIENNLTNNGFIGGCLTQRIDKIGAIYRFLETFGNLRARISKVFYGDQGIFVKRDIFFQIGGFPAVPIMEDILFTKRLRQAGKAIVLKDKIFVSARRWEKKGIIRTVILYSFLNILFWLKVPLEKIKLIYDDLR